MAPPRNRRATQSEVIVECWKQLDAESVGRRELEVISSVLGETFGASPSPAIIARTLADQGVPLAHPDILNSDTTWREQQLRQIVPGDLETIDGAFAAMENLQSAMHSMRASDIDRFRFQVGQVQGELVLFANSQIGSARARAVAGEMGAWLTVWLQNPAVFDEWLTLRRNSPEFIQKFS
ncbi:MAG TPA: hypothetical protein VLA93_16140 [Pyrinomonadaceae bacterium]|nr:hypothetical protein [Pyrinomonadaceae bacterium]